MPLDINDDNNSKSFNVANTRVTFANEFIASQTQDPDESCNNSTMVTESIDEYGNGNGKSVNGVVDKEMNEVTNKEADKILNGITNEVSATVPTETFDTVNVTKNGTRYETVTKTVAEVSTKPQKINVNSGNGKALQTEAPIIPSLGSHNELIRQIRKASDKVEISKVNPFRTSAILNNEEELKSLPYSQASPLRAPFASANSLPSPPVITANSEKEIYNCIDKHGGFSFMEPKKPATKTAVSVLATATATAIAVPSPALVPVPVPVTSRKSLLNRPYSTPRLILRPPTSSDPPPPRKTPSPVMPLDLSNRLSLLGKEQFLPDDNSSENSSISSEMEQWQKRIHSKFSIDEEFSVNIVEEDSPSNPTPAPEQVTSAQFRQAKKNGKSGWAPRLLDIGVNTIPRGVSHLSSAFISSASSKGNADQEDGGAPKSPGLSDIFSSIKLKKSHDKEQTSQDLDKWFIQNGINKPENNSSNDTMYIINGSQNDSNIIPSYSGSSVYGRPSDSNYKESVSMEEIDENKRKIIMERVQSIIAEGNPERRNVVEVEENIPISLPGRTSNTVAVANAGGRLGGLFDISNTFPRQGPLATFNSIKRNHQSLFDDSDAQEPGSAPVISEIATSTEDSEKRALSRRKTIAVRVREKFRRKIDRFGTRFIDKKDSSSSPEEEEKPSSGGLRLIGRDAYKRLTMSRTTIKNSDEEIEVDDSPMSTQTRIDSELPIAGPSEPKFGRSAGPSESKMNTISNYKTSVTKSLINKFKLHKEEAAISAFANHT